MSIASPEITLKDNRMNEAIAKLYRDQQQLEQIDAHLGGLGEDALRDLARNESARPEFRKDAVRRLMEKSSRHVGHPDLVLFVERINNENQAKEDAKKVSEVPVKEPEKPKSPEKPDVFH